MSIEQWTAGTAQFVKWAVSEKSQSSQAAVHSQSLQLCVRTLPRTAEHCRAPLLHLTVEVAVTFTVPSAVMGG